MTSTRVDRPRNRRGRMIGGAIGGGVLLLLGAGYLAAHLMATDTAPRNATVNQVAIGGLSVAEAVAKLSTELGPADTAAIAVIGEPGQQASLDPVAAGLVVDYAATVQAAGAGASWDPRVLVKVITGGGETQPVVRIDHDLLQTAVGALGESFAREPVDAQVGIEDAAVTRTPMVTGTILDADATGQAVSSAFQAAAQRPVTEPREPLEVAAKLTITEPQLSDAKADAAAQQLARLLQPITIATDQASAELSPARLAEVTTVSIVAGEFVVDSDFAQLYDLATEVIDPLTVTKPTDATVQIQGGRPVVVPAADGRSVGRDEFVAGVAAQAVNPAPRQLSLDVVTVPAKFSTADAEGLGITEVIGEFTTYYPNTGYHNTNLGLAAAGINNELIKPGEVFSLAKATGPRNASTGYIAGGVLVGDHIENIVGGGVSQSATTTYNAAFFAGMTDVEHQPHTQYFSQYPPGREATVFEGVLDLKFRNDTPHGVLMQAYIVPSSPDNRGSLTVKVWSTKYYDSVTASNPVLSNYTNGREQVSTRPGCIAQSPSQGFDVNYQRILVRGGQTTTENYFWRYSPVDKITCKTD